MKESTRVHCCWLKCVFINATAGLLSQRLQIPSSPYAQSDSECPYLAGQMSDQTVLQLAQIATNLLKWALCARTNPFLFVTLFFFSVFKPRARALTMQIRLSVRELTLATTPLVGTTLVNEVFWQQPLISVTTTITITITASISSSGICVLAIWLSKFSYKDDKIMTITRPAVIEVIVTC